MIPLWQRLCYESRMNKAFFTMRRARLVALIGALATGLGGCSMASLPQFAPASSKPVAQISAAPRPVMRTALVDVDDVVVPMSFAETKPAKPSGNSNIDSLVAKYAALYDVPASLIHRVIKRESGYNPRAKNGPYYGLMQIRHDTARAMGYKGSAGGLLDADTNLRYAVKYLRGAYIVGGYNSDKAMRNYARGYYYDAKRAGLLEEIGLH